MKKKKVSDLTQQVFAEETGVPVVRSLSLNFNPRNC